MSKLFADNDASLLDKINEQTTELTEYLDKATSVGFNKKHISKNYDLSKSEIYELDQFYTGKLSSIRLYLSSYIFGGLFYTLLHTRKMIVNDRGIKSLYCLWGYLSSTIFLVAISVINLRNHNYDNIENLLIKKYYFNQQYNKNSEIDREKFERVKLCLKLNSKIKMLF